jgi:hypothetical protein
MPPPPLMLHPLLLLLATSSFAAVNDKVTPPSATVAAGAGGGAPAPVPTPWPEQFHAVMFTNLTESGGRLQLIDLYYDWPKGRNLNLIHKQLSGDPIYDVEWTNGTSYFFDSGSCRTIHVPVGVLPPDWLAGAVYLGREHIDGFDCHLWTKVDFIWYYEEVATGRPVRWNFFNGSSYHLQIPSRNCLPLDAPSQIFSVSYPCPVFIMSSSDNMYSFALHFIQFSPWVQR